MFAYNIWWYCWIFLVVQYVHFLQRRYSLGSFNLLGHTAPAQAASLLIVGPFLDYWLTNKRVDAYAYTFTSVVSFHWDTDIWALTTPAISLPHGFNIPQIASGCWYIHAYLYVQACITIRAFVHILLKCVLFLHLNLSYHMPKKPFILQLAKVWRATKESIGVSLVIENIIICCLLFLI